MGGIVITKDMATTVKGLYAAGETGSGVFGACRIADATTEMLVQGWKAGRSAAAYAKSAAPEAPNTSETDAILETLAAPLGKKGGITGIEAIHGIQKAADMGFGICRSEENMTKAVGALETLEKDLENVSVACASTKYNYDWMCAIQAKNLLTCTLAGLRAANMRKESRGFHMRRDYPMVDNDNWAVRILETQKNGAMKLSTKKAKTTCFAIPDGVEESIPVFIKKHDLCFKNADFSN
jgi:succinate dehydrogenase / fumarate reductase flavoprotein subunit